MHLVFFFISVYFLEVNCRTTIVSLFLRSLAVKLLSRQDGPKEGYAWTALQVYIY